MKRRDFLATSAMAMTTMAQRAKRGWCEEQEKSSAGETGRKSVRIALVQFDAVPEQVEQNLQQMARLTKQAAASGARWVVFHEGTVKHALTHLAAVGQRLAGVLDAALFGLRR